MSSYSPNSFSVDTTALLILSASDQMSDCHVKKKKKKKRKQLDHILLRHKDTDHDSQRVYVCVYDRKK